MIPVYQTIGSFFLILNSFYKNYLAKQLVFIKKKKIALSKI